MTNPYAPVNFIVYDATGAILRAGQCDPAALHLQATETTESLMQVDRYYAPATHVIDVITGLVSQSA